MLAHMSIIENSCRRSVEMTQTAQICLNNFYSHIRNVLRLYDKQTVDTPIIQQSLFNSIFDVKFNKIYFNFVSLTVFAVSPLKKQVNHPVVILRKLLANLTIATNVRNDLDIIEDGLSFIENLFISSGSSEIIDVLEIKYSENFLQDKFNASKCNIFFVLFQ